MPNEARDVFQVACSHCNESAATNPDCSLRWMAISSGSLGPTALARTSIAGTNEEGFGGDDGQAFDAQLDPPTNG